MTDDLLYGAVDPTGTQVRRSRVGSVSELRASVHLMQQGFDVFRCVAPHAPFDLVAHRDGQLYRVEVKTLGRPARDTHVPLTSWPTNDDWDLLVLCGEKMIFQFAYGVTRDDVREEVRAALGIVAAEPVPSRRKTLDDRVLALLREDPERHWTTRQVRTELEENGWWSQAADPAVPVCDALRRLRKRCLITKIAEGLHCGAAATNGPELELLQGELA